MKTLRCTFIFEAPNEATYDEIEAWLKYELGNVHSISLNNPLHDTDLEAKTVMVLPYSASIGR